VTDGEGLGEASLFEIFRHAYITVPLAVLVFFSVAQVAGPVILYRYRLTRDRLDIFAFGFLRVARVMFDDIETIRLARMGDASIWNWPAWFVNRPFARFVYIRRRHGFCRKILISPKDPEEFIAKVYG